MNIHLYVYDLTRGMARAMSRQLVGIQIDAVYHTSLVFGGIEYFFGLGVQTCRPGTTHHGQPMEVIPLGTTELPMETILDYLESLKEIYTAESYDLFAHNCNNFTNDFAMFLVGRGIPEHITSLPKRVLDTPFGQMLKPQLDQGMRAVTQAPVQSPQKPRVGGDAAKEQVNDAQMSSSNGTPSSKKQDGQVINVASLTELEHHLDSARDAAATIFFTSSTCAPCKLAYPMFDQLAAAHPQATFLKLDINAARDAASHYQITATPTFITYSKGGQADSWRGADPHLLKSNIERLIQQTWPPHPHTQLKLPTLQYGTLQPVIYSKVPPLDKLMAKLDGNDTPDLTSLRTFVQQRSASPGEAPLPNLHSLAHIFRTRILQLPAETRFAAVDLLRCAMVDARVSGFFAEEASSHSQTVAALVEAVNNSQDPCPHNLRLVTLHLACNVFSAGLFVKELMGGDGAALAAQLVQLVTSSLLDAAHPTTRVAAASLAFNLAGANYRVRREEGREGLDEGVQVELAAGLLETLGAGESSAEAARLLLLALGYLVFCAPEGGEVLDLAKAMDARATVSAVKGQGELAAEVVKLLEA